MKLTPTKKGLSSLINKQKTNMELSAELVPPKPEQKTGGRKNKLPPDAYKPEFEPTKLKVREYHTKKDPTKVASQYLEAKVMRLNDDEGLPFVWLSMYQESEVYTGYLSGKQIMFPLEMLYEVIDQLNELSDECERRKIE